MRKYILETAQGGGSHEGMEGVPRIFVNPVEYPRGVLAYECQV